MSLGYLNMLGVSSTDLKGVRGGASDIKWSDVAAALSFGLSPGAQHLGFYLFAGHEDSRRIVIRLLTVIMSRQFEELRGEEMPLETAQGLAESVLVELSDRRRCTRCAGSGTVYEKVQRGSPAIYGTSKSLTACPKCGGVGVQSMSDYQRAKLAGINSKTLVRRYLNVRASGCRAYSAWLTELRDHLDAQLNPTGADDTTSH